MQSLAHRHLVRIIKQFAQLCGEKNYFFVLSGDLMEAHNENA